MVTYGLRWLTTYTIRTMIKFDYNELWNCEECGDTHSSDNLLKATNPFDESGEIIGCPSCKSIDSFVRCCEVSNCFKNATMGSKWPDGSYRNTCGRSGDSGHYPEANHA